MSITVKEAKRLEDSFLGGITEAQDAYEQIVAEEAWTVLGYDTFTEWWADRVAPLMRQLSMYPNRKLAAKVIEQVRAEEEDLPAAQRRTQRELGELVGVTQQAVSARSVQDKKLSEADLEPSDGRLCDVPGHGIGPHQLCPETLPTDPLPAPIAEQIEARIAERVTRPVAPPIQPPDPEVRERLAREREELQSREAYSKSIANAVWHLAEYAKRVDAPQWTADQWEPSQDIYPEKTTGERLHAAGDFLHALAEVWPQ